MKRFLLCMFLVVLFGVSSKSQVINDYMYYTGEDASKWIDLATYTEVPTITTSLIDMGFDFLFFGDVYRTFSVHEQGGVRLGTVYESTHNNATPFLRVPTSYRPPFILPMGITLKRGVGSYVRYAILGVPGSRIVVCEFFLARTAASSATWRFQVQLREHDCSITFVYKSGRTIAPSTAQVGIGLDIDHSLVVNPVTHSVSEAPSTDVYSEWPGVNRYYMFVPVSLPPCARSTKVGAGRVTTTSAEIAWCPVSEASCYKVSYGLDGEAGTVVTTADTFWVLDGLQPDRDYRVDVASVCNTGSVSPGRSVVFRTVCDLQKNNLFDFLNFFTGSTQCTYGTYIDPFASCGVVDDGPSAVYSRHTVHRDTTERDPRTQNLLRTVPEGACASVRLGNWASGGEAEQVIYSVEVDTLDYNLLILRYAIVEENPGHDSVEQPSFNIEVTDKDGEIVNSCYRVNFVAGEGAGWNTAPDQVVWHDWTTMGVDLSSLQGETVKIKLSNFDCRAGGHYGYSYYTLESNYKMITSTACGAELPATLSAPIGFTYRWYRAEHPEVTLSTAMTLTVNDVDQYNCDIMYGPEGSDCSYTLSINTSPRFPVARFTHEPLDACNMRQRLVNQSVVARNPAHTILTESPCEQYLWRFDDGTTSTLVNPIHTFTLGDHEVELVAMLANGQCRDSVRMTIHVPAVSDTIYDTICYGTSYHFYGNNLTDSGTYHFYDKCYDHVLKLSTYYSRVTEFRDTICRGDTVLWYGTRCVETGDYPVSVGDLDGCDSVLLLHLTVHTTPPLGYEMFQTCKGDEGDAFYFLTLPDSLDYSWTVSPADAMPPSLTPDSVWHFMPASRTSYYLHYQELDGMRCMVVDTIVLTPIEYISAAMSVSPSILYLDNLAIRAIDESRNATGRLWYVNSVLQQENGPIFTYNAEQDSDSLLLSLEAYNNSCRDTATMVIPILRHALFFPNVFSPAQAENNLFQPIGNNISDYELWIYDRWGNVVFHTDDFDEPWDGSHNGSPCKSGAYVYVSRYRISTGETNTTKGVVVLLR